MDQKIEDLSTLIGKLNIDYAKSKKTNKAACVRCRKILLDVSKLCKTLRVDINEYRKQLPKKKNNISNFGKQKKKEE